MPVDNFYRLIFRKHQTILTKAFMTARRFKHRRRSSFPALRNGQRGQALIYGIFILTISLAALFFLFNTGQMTQEKNKLVDTTDAVAYAAGILHARTLNFDAYANRALVANEVLIAQMVSLSSWSKYASKHIDEIPNVDSFYVCEHNPYGVYYNYYAGGGFYYMAPTTGPEYAVYCNVLKGQGLNLGRYVKEVTDEVPDIAEAVVDAIELIKLGITTSQDILHNGMVANRPLMMQKVADANYRGLEQIDVDVVPLVLTNDWGSFTTKYSDNDRERFAQVTRYAANTDNFVRDRQWTAKQAFSTDWQCLIRNKKSEVRRRGGTELIGYDEWKAEDTVSFHKAQGGFRRWRPVCRSSENKLGWGEQQAASDDQDESGASLGGSPSTNPDAHNETGSSRWGGYTGLPSFYDLSSDMLNKGSNLDESNSALLKFTARLRRRVDQNRTSEAKSDIKNTPVLNPYQSATAKDVVSNKNVLSQISTSEVFFRRPPAEEKNVYGETVSKPVELGSLFNPYWQVRLVQPSEEDRRAADLMQGTVRF
jgi:hypothetical protein